MATADENGYLDLNYGVSQSPLYNLEGGADLARLGPDEQMAYITRDAWQQYQTYLKPFSDKYVEYFQDPGMRKALFDEALGATEQQTNNAFGVAGSKLQDYLVKQKIGATDRRATSAVGDIENQRKLALSKNRTSTLQGLYSRETQLLGV